MGMIVYLDCVFVFSKQDLKTECGLLDWAKLIVLCGIYFTNGMV